MLVSLSSFKANCNHSVLEVFSSSLRTQDLSYHPEYHKTDHSHSRYQPPSIYRSLSCSIVLPIGVSITTLTTTPIPSSTLAAAPASTSSTAHGASQERLIRRRTDAFVLQSLALDRIPSHRTQWSCTTPTQLALRRNTILHIDRQVEDRIETRIVRAEGLMDGDLSQPMSAVHFTSFPLPPTLALTQHYSGLWLKAEPTIEKAVDLHCTRLESLHPRHSQPNSPATPN